MRRLHRALAISLILGGLTASSARAEERLVSLLPPVGRAPGAFEPLPPPGFTPGETPPPTTPTDPAAGSVVRPKGANLPRGGPVIDGCEPEAEPTQPFAIQFPIPRLCCPDFGGKLCAYCCAGDHNPADVDDPTWARFEFLMWWFQRAHLPPLITTSDDPADLGVIGNPTTRVLFGDGDVKLPLKMGGRVTIGSWFEPTETLGVEVSFGFLVNHAEKFDVFGLGNGWPLIARPFINALNGQQDSVIVATPDIPSFEIFNHQGRIIANLPGNLYSFELSGVTNYCRGSQSRIDWIYGFRYLYLSEGVGIFEGVANPSDSPEFPNLVTSVEESFTAKNYIYMPQIGIRSEHRWGRWHLETELKVGAGWNHRAAKAVGRTITEQEGVGQVFNGGMLVLSSNYGNYNADNFIVVPEVGIRLRYEVVDHFSITAGYNFLFLSEVWRPGDLIDLRLNPDLFPPLERPVNPRVPQFQNNTTSFYAQGLSLGLEFRY